MDDGNDLDNWEREQVFLDAEGERGEETEEEQALREEQERDDRDEDARLEALIAEYTERCEREAQASIDEWFARQDSNDLGDLS